jgi:putative transposase
LSDGEKIESPMPYKKAKTKLGQLQYRNRHKQLGNRRKGIKQSHNARKYRQKLSKQYYKVACKRKDFLFAIKSIDGLSLVTLSRIINHGIC